MITYENILARNFFTEGFVFVSGPSSISVSQGRFVVIGDKPEVYAYPSFEFDVESDPELSVIYDIYLLCENNEDGVNIHIDRTELVELDMPSYTESVQQIHCICSFEVPPNTTDIRQLPINVRTVMLNETESEPQESE